MDKLRIGVIGLGRMGKVHIAALKNNPRAEILGICDMDIKTTHECARIFNIPLAFKNWEDLLSEKDLDVIDIILPNHLHAPVALSALKHGKEIICEKPLALSFRELKKIENAARAANKHMYLKQYLRYSKLHQRAAELISAGALGNIYLSICQYFSNSRKVFMDKNSWRSNKKFAGGGILMEVGIHGIDFVNSILGRPAGVFGAIQGSPVEITSQSIITYPKSKAIVLCDGNSASQTNWWTKCFYGNEGHIRLTDTRKENMKLELFDNNGFVKSYEEPNWWQQTNEVAINDIITRIANKKLPRVTINDARQSLSVILGTYKSALQRKNIRL